MRFILSTLLFASLITFNSFDLNAQSNAANFEEIAETLNYYLEGGTNNDFETLEKAFHQNATMKFISGSDYREVNAVDFFREGMNPGPPQNRRTEIVSIEISGNVAHARLLIEYETFYFHDYMQLIKIEDSWKITAKIFYREDKE